MPDITLNATFIANANAFLNGDNSTLADFFPAGDAGAKLVDQYTENPDSRSSLHKTADGLIGVHTVSGDGYTERVLVHTGEGGTITCQATDDCAAQKSATYDRARVAAFFAATFGFAGLHQGDRQVRLPGQMEVLRGTAREARLWLDEAMTKFGGLLPAPEAIVITPELRNKVNKFLDPKGKKEFITAAEDGNHLVHKNPNATDESSLTGNGNGVIGIVSAAGDGSPVEHILMHDGDQGVVTCTIDYATCTGEKLNTFPKDRVLMLTAALFGFAALYDDQLQKNFAKGGSVEAKQRAALDQAFATFAQYRDPTEAPAAVQQDVASVDAIPSPSSDAPTSDTPSADASPAGTPEPEIAPTAPPADVPPPAADTGGDTTAEDLARGIARAAAAEPDEPPTEPPAPVASYSLFAWIAKDWFGIDPSGSFSLGQTAALVGVPAAAATGSYALADGMVTANRMRATLTAADAVNPNPGRGLVWRGFSRAHAAGTLPGPIQAKVVDGAGALKLEFSPRIPFSATPLGANAGRVARFSNVLRNTWQASGNRFLSAMNNGIRGRVIRVGWGALAVSAALALIPFIDSESE